MKRFLLLALLTVAFGQAARAQGFILSGMLLDANNKPLKKAAIQAVSNDKLVFGNSNEDGLYFTGELPEGKYEVIIVADKVTYISRVDIASTDPRKRFYNFKIEGKKAVLTTTDKDPFMESAMAKVRNAPIQNIEPKRSMRIQTKRKQ